jgi:hypothetical protein
MALGCTKDNCTVADTGICIAENPPETCPFRMKAPADISTGATPAPPLSRPAQNPTLPHSRSLTPEQASELMAARYQTLVGILGDPDAGKTGALVSLFLLISRAKLRGYSFADSRTLSAFNEISQGALDWDENDPPEQFTQHTEMADPRTPGFLHLRLRRGEDEKIDFLLPDLPGEWSQSFIDEDNNARLQFLKRADVIWLLMDGSQLRKPSTRHYVLHRTQLLIGRLRDSIGDLPPLVLALSRRDGGEVPPSVLTPLIDEAKAEGLQVSIVQIASFGDENVDVKPGFGIDKLMETCRRDTPERSPTWPDSGPQFDEVRAMLRYRRPERQS